MEMIAIMTLKDATLNVSTVYSLHRKASPTRKFMWQRNNAGV